MTSERQPATGGLRVPRNIGVAESEQKAVHNHWDTIGKVEGTLAMEGFVAMECPSFQCPMVTEEVLTTADSKAYTEAYAQQLAWFNYASQTLARATAHLLQVTNEMEMIEARMRRQFREGIRNGGGKMTEKEMADEIMLDDRYSELLHFKQVTTQRKIELQAFTEGVERGLKVISRQVEIRKMEMEQSRVNIPGRGYGVRSP